jgi:hypothetical protein
MTQFAARLVEAGAEGWRMSGYHRQRDRQCKNRLRDSGSQEQKSEQGRLAGIGTVHNWQRRGELTPA